MMQVVCCQLAVRLETGTLGLATERTSDGAWVESSVSSACLVRCVALELRGEVLAFVFIMYKPDPATRFGGRKTQVVHRRDRRQRYEGNRAR